jgi:hypothetical protein
MRDALHWTITFPKLKAMRTTLNVDPRALVAAKALAAARGAALGDIVSELVLEAVAQREKKALAKTASGFPVFTTSEKSKSGKHRFGLEEVEAGLEDGA